MTFLLTSKDRPLLVRNICQRTDLLTHDPYDIWMTPVGFRVKNSYNHHRLLALPAASFLTLFDLYVNDRLRFFCSKREYPIVRALAAQSLLKLYSNHRDSMLLMHAARHLEWLRDNSCTGYSGPCWGLGFRYAVGRNLIYGPNMPLTTMTAYALEAFADFTRLTGDSKWIPLIEGVFQFLERDIVVMEQSEDMLVTSYAAMHDRRVTNAVSYVMYSYAVVLPYLDARKRESSLDKILRLYNFITAAQSADGSWMYSPIPTSFIDCFHSCFILKNLIKTSSVVTLPGCDEVVRRGYAFLKQHMYDQHTGLFKRFAKANKPGLIRFDLYDNAEMLQLAHLMGDEELAVSLEKVIARVFVRRNHIFSQIDFLGLPHGPDRLRWAVMPYLHALAVRECNWRP